MLNRIVGIGLAALLAVGLVGYPSSGFTGDATTTELLAAPKHQGGGGAKGGAPKAKAVNKNVNAKKNVNVNKKVNVNKNVNVKKNVNINRNVNVHYSRGYRAWVARPYYGTAFIGAVALGTVIAVTAPHVIPVAPGPNACWYWSDPTEIHGYWDYCTPP